MPVDRRAAWLTWALVAACAVFLAPLAPAMMLALWLGAFARILHTPLTRLLGGRARLAAAVTVVAVTLLAVPFVVVVMSLAADAYDFVVQLIQSPRGKQVLEQLAAPNAPATRDHSGILDLMLSQQERAWRIVLQIAGTATRAVIALVVILAGTYAVLIEGERWYRWVEAHAPIPVNMLARLRDAFFETGRGLFIGIGGAGLLQAIIATIIYLVLEIPHALELGVLTFCASIVPAVGTAFVWIPVSAGLALTGRPVAATVLAAFGVAVIGTIDNLVRPFLSRWGHLQLPTYLVLVSMFAGVEVMGPWGLLVAPLTVRLAKAALESISESTSTAP